MNTWIRRLWPISPKARVVFAVLFVLACAALLFLAFTKKQKSPKLIDPDIALKAARAEQVALLTKDSDADGLKDWEEAIFRTDPYNKDTDNDGADDSTEISHGRDPLKPGPNDLVATSTPLNAAGENPGQSPNLTQRLATALGQRLIAQRLLNPNQQINPKTIGQEIVKGIPQYTPETPFLTLNDLAIAKDDSAPAIKTWATQFDAAIKETFGSHTQPEVLILIGAMQTENYATLSQLDPYLRAYDAAFAKIEKIPVPPSFAPYELDFLKIMLQWREIVSRFRDAEKDPVAAMSGIKPYFTLADELQTLNKKIQMEFTKRHITF